jgi:benzodiazapine receptor
MLSIFRLLVSILICQLAGVVGSLFTFRSLGEWYVFIRKPPFTPPDYIFGPVWITLFTLMGISLFLVWQKGIKNGAARSAVLIFFLQLGLNTLWSIIFFGGRFIVGGFVVIILLWSAIFWNIKRFFAISKPAAILLLPYILWVSFAAVLNASLVILNR